MVKSGNSKQKKGQLDNKFPLYNDADFYMYYSLKVV